MTKQVKNKEAIRKIINFAQVIYDITRYYFYAGNFRKKHIVYGWVKGKFQIASIDHQDFIVGVRKKINKLAKNADRKTLIKSALTEALGGCNFIIFSVVGGSNKFVQFWTGEHQLQYDFYANHNNKLKKYFRSVVGLLSEIGFVNDSVLEYKGRLTFKIDKDSDHISIQANFRKDLNLATEFVNTMFQEIYQAKGDKLVVEVE